MNAKARIADAMLRWCTQSLGSRLEALVLTGSLARNEATWHQTEVGVQFLSDAEFIVIIKDDGEIPSPALATLICRGAEEELRNQGVACKLSFGAVHDDFLQNLGDTIFGYELLTCGEVVYGDSRLLVSKAQPVSHVSREDAWRMLANRTVELLEIVPELVREDPLTEAAQYRLTKLYCDMATSVLAFKEEFVPGYQARADKLCDLHERGTLSDLPFDASWFVNMVRRCTDYKIMRCRDSISLFNSRELVREAIVVLRSLWAWELARMLGTPPSSPDKLLGLRMRRQKLKERLRGWGFVVRHRGFLDSLRHSWRWLRLLRCGSPRYCVYVAGLETISSFASPPSTDPDSTGLGELENWNSKFETVARWLPVVNVSVHTAPDETEIAEAILWNYREFLVETRA